MRIDPKVYNRRYDRRIVRDLKEEEKKLRCVIGSDWYRAEMEHPKEWERLRQVIAEIKSRCESEVERLRRGKIEEVMVVTDYVDVMDEVIAIYGMRDVI